MLFGYFVGPTTPLIWYVIVLAAFWMLWLVRFFPAFLRAWMNMSAPKYPDSAVWVIGSVVLGLVVALVTIVGPARRDARTHSADLQGDVARVPRRPLWARVYLDLGLLAVGGLIFWEAVQNGYEVVLAPEGLPTISVSYFTLLAPLCLWVGAALFAWRVSSWTLRKGRRPVARIAKPVAGGLAGVVAASMTRQEPLLTRALVITALAATFALSTSVFNATYAAQARVDAELTTVRTSRRRPQRTRRCPQASMRGFARSPVW